MAARTPRRRYSERRMRRAGRTVRGDRRHAPGPDGPARRPLAAPTPLRGSLRIGGPPTLGGPGPLRRGRGNPLWDSRRVRVRRYLHPPETRETSARMGAVPVLADGGFALRLSLWWAHHSHRYVLPILGGGALAAGAAFALLGPVHVAVPPAGVLLILGATSISISAVTTALRMRLESEWSKAPPPRAPVTTPPCPSCSEPGESHHAAHDFLRQIEVWHLLRRRGATAAFASTTGATPSDFIWSSWVHAASELPVPLVGPVPETAYFLPDAGTSERFPEHGVP